MTDHTWANVIRSGCDDQKAEVVINAINTLTSRGGVNSAAVIIA